ncbi:tyrosine-protein phosphatase [Pseudoroseicyclus sp. CXY001]|uniref:tyrosine-protein phosphatase n=1 Tax=Pseudoroseicyclus sp. CXY001 TaxID=3242492 RepID=UPI003570C23B
MEKPAISFTDVAPEVAEAYRPTLGARWSYAMKDHAILRRHWHNFAEVAPGVFRSNHPTVGRLRTYRQEGMRAILSLRGAPPSAAFRIEAAACRELGLALWATPLQARAAAPREAYLRLFEIFRRIERPFLMHCKSGADRTGIAATLYLASTGVPLAEARAQLGWHHLHRRKGKTAILDDILDLYAEDAPRMGPEEWFATRYDPAAIQAAFDAGELGPK